MEYIKATEVDLEQIVILVQDTIRTIYPEYYPKEVVTFFCEHHCKENIYKDIKSGCVGILKNNNEIIGTGCYKDNHITRVYVKPTYQRQGYGSYIMQCLEDEIGLKYETVYLDASLPACHLYEKRGYQTIKHERLPVGNGAVLVYEIMEKHLKKRKFSLRSAALIVNENKLLLVKNQKLNCFYTVGGGIEENEPSEKAVNRECYEEMGCHFEVDRLVFIHERFYDVKGVSHHEIVFFYLMKGIDMSLVNGINTDQADEHLYWMPIEELEKINLVPSFLKAAVKELPNEIAHIITHE